MKDKAVKTTKKKTEIVEKTVNPYVGSIERISAIINELEEIYTRKPNKYISSAIQHLMSSVENIKRGND